MDEEQRFGDETLNSHDPLILPVASALHEDWRERQLDRATGLYKPRLKKTSDEGWKKNHPDLIKKDEQGSDVIDIANRTYEELPADHQMENRASAIVAVAELRRTLSKMELTGEQFDEESERAYIERAAELIHNAWLDRNRQTARFQEQLKAYKDLPEDEKKWDRIAPRLALEQYKDELHEVKKWDPKAAEAFINQMFGTRSPD